MAAELSRQALADCLTQQRDLRCGHHHTTTNHNALVQALTQRAQHSVGATSADAQGLHEWWASPAGQAWWRLNLEALNRNVTIYRIFAYRDWNDQLATLIKEQHSQGVHTMRVAMDRLPQELRVNLTLWDETCGLDERANSIGEFVDNSYTFAPQDLIAMLERYKAIESSAEPWPAESGHQPI